MRGVFCEVCKRWFPGKPGSRHTCLARLREEQELRASKERR